ncbi:cytochrome P450 2D17 [Falco rusticolus]|uniref:cytochrome P450 2D17 n=1 Tax=Falco cherrug TaxID=345164 RepID=UPI000392EF6B|nr:cytochrome P450 2D17 [Falco cherrug]XP_037245712.1 cytochrome P450 2D17 [Falco rusticolus]XP_037245713.1 cytochrome P450 2D17 [Falco rusticolus]
MALALWLGSLLSSCWQNLSILGVFLTVFTLLLDFMKRRKKWSRYPPGPVSLPFIGTMLHVDFCRPHVSFKQLHKKFGNVFNLQNCWTNVVVLNGYQTVKDALVHKSEDFADRPYFPVYEHLGYGSKSEGIIVAKYGPIWKELRRFTLSTLRNFGMGKKSLEERVTEEAGFLCSAVESEEGKPFDLRFLVNNAVCNVICTTVYGERFNYGDETFKMMLHLFESSLNEETGFLPQLLNVLPILLRIPGVPQMVFRGQKVFMDFIDVLIEKHMETWNPAHIRDFTDVFLKEMKKGKEAEESGFNYNNLRLVTADLFIAGSETTSTTLRWAFLYMLLHPEIQSKVQAEIDKVIGKEKPPTMKDQVSMPYTNAVIHEVQRCGDIVPVGLPHMTYRDTEVQGFFIPKGTTVITNLSSVLKDETVWEKPNEFYPEHFLDANGQFVKPEAFLPFSAGRRACPGEQLARMELFIFFTTLMQKFTFVLPEDQPRPREDGHFALTNAPHPYLIRAVPR